MVVLTIAQKNKKLTYSVRMNNSLIRIRKCFTFVLYLLIGTMYSCKEVNDSYFNGGITIIEKFNQEIDLPSKNVSLEDIYDGSMIVCDSFLLFKSYKYPDYWFYAFNVNSGELVASFCPKGGGPEDFFDCVNSEQFIREGTETKIWVRDNLKNARLINLTESIRLNQTVCDSIIPMEWYKYFQYPATSMFFLDGGLILAQNQCEEIYDKSKEYAPKKSHIYNRRLENEIKEFTLFNKPIINNETLDYPYMNYYASIDRMRPDQSQMAMAMRMVGQINIMDVKTGELKGFCMKESATFDDLKSNIHNYRAYYTSISVNNKFIFASYANVMSELKNSFPYYSKCIHVFSWEGKPICKINLEEKIFSIALDDQNDILYAKDWDENIYKYDVSFLDN